MIKMPIFFKIISLTFNSFIPVNFPLVKMPLKYLFSYGVNFRKQKINKSHGDRSSEY